MDEVVCISREVREDLLRYWKKFEVSEKATPLLMWPVPFTGARPGNTPNQQSRQVLYVARLKLRKNHLVLLDACEKVWKKGVDFSLNLVGVSDAFFDTGLILARVSELKSKGRMVRWLKHISDDELNEAYKNSAFTAFPSKMEGFGLPIIESLWHRRPVICGRNGAIGEVAREGGGCYLIDQNNTDELAEAIERLLEDRDFYHELYQQSDSRKFRSWTEYGDDLEELLRLNQGLSEQ
ncbi:MAG: glycosyltransferase family 4 protein [Blastochloris sp.]|nr:glycosyltransferase family 4 protein [Blastochloris sp.]